MKNFVELCLHFIIQTLIKKCQQASLSFHKNFINMFLCAFFYTIFKKSTIKRQIISLVVDERTRIQAHSKGLNRIYSHQD